MCQLITAERSCSTGVFYLYLWVDHDFGIFWFSIAMKICNINQIDQSHKICIKFEFFKMYLISRVTHRCLGEKTVTARNFPSLRIHTSGAHWTHVDLGPRRSRPSSISALVDLGPRRSRPSSISALVDLGTRIPSGLTLK